MVKEWAPFLNKDFDITTTSTWNYALTLDPKNPGASLTFDRAGAPGAIPFNITNYPSVIKGKVRQLPGWTEDRQAAAEPPVSPLSCETVTGGCGEEKTVLFVPHGSTDLRMSGLPWVTPK